MSKVVDGLSRSGLASTDGAHPWVSTWAEAGRGAISSASSAASTTLSIAPEILALAVALAMGGGVVGRSLPARRASRMNPVEAPRRS